MGTRSSASPKRRRAVVALLACVGAFQACSDDDGSSVRDDTEVSAPGGGSASAVAGAAASADGTDDPRLVEAADAYKAYVIEQVAETVTATATFTDAVRAGDVEAAKAAYAPSRQGWERIEPAASLVEELDGKLDARVDDFTGEDDPAFTGWHRLEHQLWEVGTIDEAAKDFADRLDEDLQVLQDAVAGLDFPPAVLAVGSSELIEEAANGKLTGEEDRYSHTDLWDIAANVEGSKAAFELLKPALEEHDAELAAAIDELFSEADGQVAATRQGDGFQSFVDFEDASQDEMKATLADLSEHLSQMAGALGLGG
jgi:iron uptake system component EfeO